jgi:hypothetical protein
MGLFPGRKYGRRLKVTADLDLVLRIRMSVAILLLSVNVFMS